METNKASAPPVLNGAVGMPSQGPPHNDTALTPKKSALIAAAKYCTNYWSIQSNIQSESQPDRNRNNFFLTAKLTKLTPDPEPTLKMLQRSMFQNPKR